MISRPVQGRLTTTHPRPENGGVVVKGLAKHENRLRHVLRDKCVDASLFEKERLLPNDRINLNSSAGDHLWTITAVAWP